MWLSNLVVKILIKQTKYYIVIRHNMTVKFNNFKVNKNENSLPNS